MKIFTLVLVMRNSEILLGLKKRGLGEGKWNGFGGKVEFGETVIRAAMRELCEESGIVADECNLLQRGIITMDFANGEDSFEIHVFLCTNYKGEITETEEMKPQWFDIHHIPYDLMWSEARLWYPVFLSGHPFEASFSYDIQGHIINHAIIQLP